MSLSERDDELRARCCGGCSVAFDRSSDFARESSLDFRLRGVWNVPHIASKSEVSMRINGRALVVGLLHSSDLNSMGSSAEPGRLGDSGSCLMRRGGGIALADSFLRRFKMFSRTTTGSSSLRGSTLTAYDLTSA